MDFFGAQDHARGMSLRFAALFVLSVVAVLAVLYPVIWLLVFHLSPLAHPATAGTVGALALVMAGGTLYKRYQVGDGTGLGLEMGGRCLDPGSTDSDERRLLNVVEEMAIASGIPVPSVYVLEHEASLNAFTAGTQPDNALIGVTRPLMERFSRDELQAVIAHEFSHILNGDMRMSVRMIGWLHGLTMVSLVGRTMLLGDPDDRRRGKRSGGGLVLGSALVLIGSLGVLAARLAKAGVSRQREFLADAAAVQFTRHPDGLVSALCRLGTNPAGSRIRHPRAEQVNHMLFGTGTRGFALLSTHPPLTERVRRLDPAAARALEMDMEDGRAMDTAGWNEGAASLLHAARVRATPSLNAAPVWRELPQELVEAAHDADGARALLWLLVGGEATDTTTGELPTSVREQMLHLEEAVAALDAQHRLPLVEIAAPVLRCLSVEEQDAFLGALERVITRDGQLDLHEFAVIELVRDALGRNRPYGGRLGARDVAAEIALVLAAFAHEAGAGTAERESAFRDARAMLTTDPLQLRYPQAVTFTPSLLATALARLARLDVPTRRRLLDACARTIERDTRVDMREYEMLRAVAARLRCPLPPVAPAA